MTIKEVLEADINIDRIGITIRKEFHYVMSYAIGQDVKPSSAYRYRCSTKAGDVYEKGGLSVLFMNRTIQFDQLEKVPKSQIGLRGVLTEKIPKELLSLKIDRMSPRHTGHADDLHGYIFECCLDYDWQGIPEEFKQTELEDESDYV